jgi:hypothetical protein
VAAVAHLDPETDPDTVTGAEPSVVVSISEEPIPPEALKTPELGLGGELGDTAGTGVEAALRALPAGAVEAHAVADIAISPTTTAVRREDMSGHRRVSSRPGSQPSYAPGRRSRPSRPWRTVAHSQQPTSCCRSPLPAAAAG